MKDHRNLLAHKTTRKPNGWDETPLIRKLADLQIQALRDLPQVIETESDSHPMDDIFPENSEKTETLEAIVVWQTSPETVRTFYVNTEGATYARYAFEFNPSILED